MRKIVLSIFLFGVLATSHKLKAQCTLQFANLVVTPTGQQSLGATQCEYTFNASFDIKTNSGFKYLFFHTWKEVDYPATPIFDCGNSNAQDPGTHDQLGTDLDQPGKSFMDIGFINLNTLTFAPNVAVDVTAFFATSFPHDNTVELTQPLNAPDLEAFITRKGSTDTLHFDVTGIRIVINDACGSLINPVTDIWGSNSNANDPKAQCYICGLTQSFNDPLISLLKLCGSSPFSYDLGLTTESPTDIHVVYRLYAHDPLLGNTPLPGDPLLFTSDTVVFKSTNPFNPPAVPLPSPYCCIDPWAQWDIYVTIAGREFSNIISTPLVAAECATLPVNLKSFTAVRKNVSYVEIKWETAQEENSKGFNIQRKLSNGGWETIGYVETKAINGNSNSPLSYEFTDFNNAKGITQYRLRQLDINGKQSYSLIRAVRGDGQKGKTIVFPNPSNDGKVNVVFEDKDVSRNVSLTDMNGRVIKQWKNVLSNTLQIENLISGFYTLRIINPETGGQIVEKIVVKNR